ncbi:MAG: IscS subfamily cysteine desulfurase [Gammaproteobacteria bacterium]|nr:IscS subfamily cysteine desulfurase [Gammaproteobacteria bacterium]
MSKPIYLDYMSTTPIDPRVREKMLPYLEDFFGNPASKHYYGYQAHAAVEEARSQVANLISCDPKNIIWTSGATEANNLAIKGASLFYQRQGKHIITSKTEHKSILDPCEYLETIGFEITYLTPKSDGLIDLRELEQALRQDTILVSIMHVNNETGVIQDIAKIGEITHSKGILLHVDAAQSAGKIPLNLQKLKIDLISFSAHKIYGPKGIGALYIRSTPKLHLVPQIHGGSQENNLRAGTLATHQIVGMGEAFNIASQEMITEGKHILELQEKLWQGIKNLGDVYINGSLENRIPGNLNISFSNINGELLIAALKDLALSSVSACTQTAFEGSYVLKAMGIRDDLISNNIRFSFGRFTTKSEIDFAIKHINDTVTKLRGI